jgi:hypothetical protein
MAGDKAKDALVAAGFSVNWSENVVIASNWTVDAQDPAAGATAQPGAKVTLTASKPAATSAAPDPNDVTPSGLDFQHAMSACDQAGKAQYPYGWNANFITDGTHMVQDGKMFWKAGVDITNALGTKGHFTVECLVSGTNDEPVVESLITY